MKYFPKSKVGAAIAGAYLLLLIILLMVAMFGEAGLHAGNGYKAAILIFVLTLPISGVAIAIGIGLFFPVMVVLGALFNAAIIYLVCVFVSKLWHWMFTRRLK